MPIQRRDSRLDIDAPLRPTIPASDLQALSSLLQGELPRSSLQPPFLAHPRAARLFTGSGLDHATTGSRLIRSKTGHHLQISASLPPDPNLLNAALAWLSGLLDLSPGDIAGFIVPAGAPRHDVRLLVWDGATLRPLEGAPDRRHAVDTGIDPECSDAAFLAAADLPPPHQASPQEARQLAFSLATSRPPFINHSMLDGPLPHGHVARLREWLISYAAEVLHLSAAPPPPLVHLG